MLGCKHKHCGMRRRMMGVQHGTDRATPADFDQTAATFRLSTGESLEDASLAGPLVLIFLRHFGCTFTRQILRGLEGIQGEARARGARLILIHMLRGGSEIRYLSGHDDIASIADPHCELYRAFGLGKGGIVELFGPRVWWLGFVSIFKGCGVGHLAGDGRQMPGAFLFHKGKIIASQRARSASDLPDLAALFKARKEAETP